MKRIIAVILCVLLCSQTCYAMSMDEVVFMEEETAADTGLEVELSAETAILMEAETGTVLFEQDADKELPPASVTKVMTLLLIFDALKEGKISLDEEVMTSEYAASMGGSQVFLEVGEKQTVDTLIKCIAVASANDACVAMAERIAGTEEQFVQRMNERAKGLGMEHTNFVNCNGLDTDGHETTARDIALMSRELILNYPQIFDYTQIWMENITHVTAKGESEFGLSNTNKLIRQYEYATGLKTGSTSQAKFCLSATGAKDGIQMIAVVMAEPDAKSRTKDAIKLLNYGFGRCNFYKDENALEEPVYAEVKKGKEDKVTGMCEEKFQYVDFDNTDFSQIRKEVEMETLNAPVEKGEEIGKVSYFLDDNLIGEVPILAETSVGKMKFTDAVSEILEKAASF
mgnify:FL=1